MGTLIKNGTVVNADGSKKADVLIEGEKIAKVGAHFDPTDHTVVDATDLLVMPGGIDVHTHLDMPFGGTVSADDYTTGTQAAAVGGTTMLIDFALQSQGHTMREAFDTWRRKSDNKACIDFSLHMAVTDLGPGDGAQGLARDGRDGHRWASPASNSSWPTRRADDQRRPDVSCNAEGRKAERALLHSC